MFNSSQKNTQQSNQTSNNNYFTPFFYQASDTRSFFDIINSQQVQENGIFNGQDYNYEHFSFHENNQQKQVYEQQQFIIKNRDKQQQESIIDQLRDQNFDFFNQTHQQDQTILKQNISRPQLMNDQKKQTFQQSYFNLPQPNVFKRNQTYSYADKQVQSWHQSSQHVQLKASVASCQKFLQDYPQTIFQQEHSKLSQQLSSDLKSSDISKDKGPFCESVVRQFSSDFRVFNKSYKRIQQKQEVKKELISTPQMSEVIKQNNLQMIIIQRQKQAEPFQRILPQSQSQGITSKPPITKYQFKLKKINFLGSKKIDLPKGLKVVPQKELQQSQKMKQNKPDLMPYRIEQIKVFNQNVKEEGQKKKNQSKLIQNIPKIQFKFNLKKSRVQDSQKLQKKKEIQKIVIKQELQQKINKTLTAQAFAKPIIQNRLKQRKTDKVQQQKFPDIQKNGDAMKDKGEVQYIRKPANQPIVKIKRFSFLNSIKQQNQKQKQKQKVAPKNKQIKTDDADSFSSQDSLIDTKGIIEQVKENQNRKNKQGKFQFKKSTRILNNLKLFQKEDKSKLIIQNQNAKVSNQQNIYKSDKTKQQTNQRISVNTSITTPRIIKNSFIYQNYNDFQKTQKQKKSKSITNQVLFDELDSLFQMRDVLKAKRERLKTEYSELYSFATSISNRMKEKLGCYMH